MGEYEPVWVNILGGLGGGARRAPTGTFEFFRCPEMNDGRRGGEAKAPFPTPNISAVPEAI